MALTLNTIPGFTDVADILFDAGAIVYDDNLLRVSHNAKFATVRCEYIYMGYYKHGDTVPLPYSPVDGYQYQQAEVMFDWSLRTTRAPDVAFTSGQAAAPGIAPSQIASQYYLFADIDDSTGNVTITDSYYKPKGAETVTNDGVVKVFAICQRASVNVPN